MECFVGVYILLSRYMVMVAIGRSILSSVGTVTENAKDREEEVLNDGVIIQNILTVGYRKYICYVSCCQRQDAFSVTIYSYTMY